jgi:ribosomal 50S subunit-recycling heat shock protein
MTNISIKEFIKQEKNKDLLKIELKKSTFKPKIKAYIRQKDPAPKRKLLINLTQNQIVSN